MNHLTSPDNPLTRKLTEIILSNLENEGFGAKELAREMGMSSFNLNRKLHSICRKTINPFIREVRLQKAMEMLCEMPGTASEAGFKVGFSSPAYFSTCFSEYYGYPPGEVKKNGLNGHLENGKLLSAQTVTATSEPAGTGNKPPQRILSNLRIQVVSIFSILFVLIPVFFFNPGIFSRLIPGSVSRLQSQSRSIAVLPFINDSKDQENVYFINGVLEAILDNLSRINDLEVRPRTSVEQYRNNRIKTIPQIASELGVNYIIEGSGQKIGDQVSLYIQLIEASSDKHLFSKRYNMKLEDIYNLQSDVAVEVASEIKAVIASEAMGQREETSSSNSEARNLFLQANDIHSIAESENKWELDIKAERLYKRAIRLDSTYADPYVSLGWIIYYTNLDSALYLADRALHFDPENPEANVLKGFIYGSKGMDKEAEEALKLSIKYKADNSSAYCYLGEIYFGQGNCSRAVENQLQAFRLKNNLIQERYNVKSFCASLYYLGFYKEGEKYASRLLELNNDSSYYYWGLASANLDHCDYKAALNSALKMYSCDTNEVKNIYLLMYTYIYLRDFSEAGRLLQKYERNMKELGRKVEPDYLLGFVYLKNGNKKEADRHFNGVIREMSRYIALKEPSNTCVANMTLAKIYSALDEKEKAMEYLQKVKNSMGTTFFRLKDFKYCTMLDNIRHEPGFNDFIMEAETRYRHEHQKVERLLRHEGILTSML